MSAVETGAAERRCVENRPSRRRFPLPNPRELYAYRDLALVLAERDVKVRYKQTLLGVVWIGLQPLVSAGVFTLIFGGLAGVPSAGLPYVVFVFAGLLAWNFFAAGTTRAMSSLVGNESLVSKVYFPRLLAPLAAILPGILDLLTALPILVVLAVLNGIAPGPQLLLLPLLLIALVAFTSGVGAYFAALHVKYRDVAHLLGFITQLWFFATPVVYASSLIKGELERTLYYLNPMAGLVDGLRWCLVGGQSPGSRALLSVVTGAVIVVAGIAYFQRTERRFADLI
jgi:lipopolysaccharide transport system permease protein